MFVKIKKSEGNVLGYNVKGVITHEDYEQLIPEVYAVISEHGTVRLYMDISGLENIALKAIIDDTKFYFKYNKDIEKIALVGNNKIEEMLIKISAIFMNGECKYFDTSEMDEAWDWISL